MQDLQALAMANNTNDCELFATTPLTLTYRYPELAAARKLSQVSAGRKEVGQEPFLGKLVHHKAASCAISTTLGTCN